MLHARTLVHNQTQYIPDDLSIYNSLYKTKTYCELEFTEGRACHERDSLPIARGYRNTKKRRRC